MTESEWMACSDPSTMLRYVRDERIASHRKLRLFSVACCRRVWPRLADPRSLRAVEVAERYADGEATTEQLSVASQEAWDAHLGQADAAYHAARAAYYSANDPSSPDAEDVADAVIGASYLDPDDPEVEERAQADLCREVFGNPFRRPLTLDAFWLTSDVVALAEGIYAEQGFDRMPILADALEEAGCTRTDFLAHSREPGEHARGCWVVDTLLGKS